MLAVASKMPIKLERGRPGKDEQQRGISKPQQTNKGRLRSPGGPVARSEQRVEAEHEGKTRLLAQGGGSKATTGDN